MKQDNRPVVIVGNWKMYKTLPEAQTFVQELSSLVQETSILVYLAVPFTIIRPLVAQMADTPIAIGAQNMHDASEGAYTGEIAGRMLKETGARFVILGHSERRRLFHESNAIINRKMQRAVEEELQPILCIGETLEEREQGLTQQVLATQLTECLEGFKGTQLQSLMLAYEPVWAIGTDKNATPEIAEEVHLLCRNWLEENLGKRAAKRTPILYGGSVKPVNATEILKQPNVDGLLVGGASLSAKTFGEIINSAQNLENQEGS